MVKALREKTGGDDCVNHLKEGIQQVDMMLKANPEVIEKEFKLVNHLKLLALLVCDFIKSQETSFQNFSSPDNNSIRVIS